MKTLALLPFLATIVLTTLPAAQAMDVKSGYDWLSEGTR